MAERLFFGIPVTAPAATELELQLTGSFPDGIPGRAVPRENWHLTLRFLGSVAPDEAARLRTEVARGPLGRRGPLELRGLGAYPSPRRARVLWVGVAEGAELIGSVASELEQRVRRAGFPPEKRPFSPHLTLSRFRQPVDLEATLRSASGPLVHLPLEEVVLFRSHLGGAAPRYEAVDRFSL